MRRVHSELVRCGVLLAGFAVLTAVGCWSRGREEVVVYAALDREFAEPILEAFERESGIQVLAKYDVESTKTVGLVSAIIQEQNRPRCDLFWNNEILHTLRLQKLGLLDVYASPLAQAFPENYRSPVNDWFGLAARARVLIVNKELVDAEDFPASIEDLADERWRGRVGIAKPLAGTTATHAAVLFAVWGDERATAFFQAIKQNADVLSGNKQVAAAVGRGQLAFGITDTDDAIIEVDNGMPVEIVFPDQQSDGLGALFIPNTLCVIKGSRNTERARQLVDYLLAPAVEAKLARGRSAQFPVNPHVTTRSRALPERPAKWMDIDFAAAADKWDSASQTLREIFVAAE
jgi:iron(III) transport system substrate-binding protein